MEKHRATIIVIATLVLPLLAVAAGYVVFDRFFGLNGIEEPPLIQVATDDFESETTNWQLGAGWEQQVIEATEPTTALAAGGSPEATRYGEQAFRDVAVSIRFWVDTGEARLNLRASAAGTYSLGLGPTGRVRLYRDATLLGEDYADAVLAGSPWHTLRFSAIEDRLAVDVDGKEMFLVADRAESGPLPAGAITLSAGETPATFYVDDFALSVPAPTGEK